MVIICLVGDFVNQQKGLFSANIQHDIVCFWQCSSYVGGGTDAKKWKKNSSDERNKPGSTRTRALVLILSARSVSGKYLVPLFGGRRVVPSHTTLLEKPSWD